MIVVTTDEIEDRQITRVLGLVRGHNNGTFRNMAEIWEEAAQRMCQQAEELGANAIVGARFMASMDPTIGSAVLAYGTAVIVEEK